MPGHYLIISAVFPPEPVVSGKLSLDLYHCLKDNGVEVKVMHPYPTRPYGFKFDDKKNRVLGDNEIIADSYVCPQSSLLGRMRESWSFGRASKRYIVDHHSELQCIYANSWPMFSQLAIVSAAKRFGIPCVIHVQDVYPESLSNKTKGLAEKIIQSLFLPVDKYILRRCTKVIAISEKMKAYLVKTRNISEDKVSVVINWQDEKEFIDYQKVQAVPEKSSVFTFMYMGNIGPVAGVDLLIDAFTKANLHNAKLVIAGSGSAKDQLIKKANSNPCIEFREVPNGKVPEIQSMADVMMLPIRKGAASSSIPSKLPAYMFSAKPIIGSMDIDSDTANAIRDAKCGWVIDSDNIDALSETMKEARNTDPDLLKEKGKNAQEYGIKYFSKDVNLGRLANVILGTTGYTI